MNKSLVFIIPYFGHFKNYFNLFLKSCENNPTINWIIYTDNHNNYDYPDNVKVVYTTFDKIKNRFQQKFDFPITLDNPYKLCDFKPTYGYVFQEDISNYDYWGYCDTDLIFGDIRKFVNADLEKKLDKIGFFGHCTIIKNTKKNNEIFKSKLHNSEIYKKVYSSNDGFAFDEEFHDSINDIFVDNNMSCNFEERQANIYRKSSNFRLTKYDFKKHEYTIEKNKKAFFIYNNGKILRYYINSDVIDEYLYIHMQARPMKVNTTNFNLYKIIPNSFDSFDLDELKNKNRIKIKHFNFHYFKHRKRNLIMKIKKKLKKL